MTTKKIVWSYEDYLLYKDNLRDVIHSLYVELERVNIREMAFGLDTTTSYSVYSVFGDVTEKLFSIDLCNFGYRLSVCLELLFRIKELDVRGLSYFKRLEFSTYLWNQDMIKYYVHDGSLSVGRVLCDCDYYWSLGAVRILKSYSFLSVVTKAGAVPMLQLNQHFNLLANRVSFWYVKDLDIEYSVHFADIYLNYIKDRIHKVENITILYKEVTKDLYGFCESLLQIGINELILESYNMYSCDIFHTIDELSDWVNDKFSD